MERRPILSSQHRRFGLRMFSFRKKIHLTQEELAERAGVDPGHIANIERGARNTTLTMVFKIAHALRIKPEELLK